MNTLKRQLAELARHWAEMYAIRYNEANPTHIGYGEAMDGMCAIASSHLWFLFQDAGFKPKIAFAQDPGNGGHVFVIEGEEIWDITATQFAKRHAEVVTMPLGASQCWYWKPQQVFLNPAAFREEQITRGWPEYQTIPADKAKVA